MTLEVWFKNTIFVTYDSGCDSRLSILIGRGTNQMSENSKIIGTILKVVLVPNRFKDGLKLLCSIQRWHNLCYKNYFQEDHDWSFVLFICTLFRSVLVIPKKVKRILSGHCSMDLMILEQWNDYSLFDMLMGVKIPWNKGGHFSFRKSQLESWTFGMAGQTKLWTHYHLK